MATAQKPRSEEELRVRHSWKPIGSVAGLITIWTWALNVIILGILISREIRKLSSEPVLEANESRKTRFMGLSLLWNVVITLGAVSAVMWYWAWPGFAVYVVAGTFLNDIAAMYIGRKLGSKLTKRPFAPKLSPKKTWEGALGGTVASIIAALVTWLVAIALHTPLDWRWYDWVGFGLAASFGAITGDLLGSALKRAVDVKDSGDVFGPQGGWLDRFGNHFGAFLMVSVAQVIVWCL